MSTALQDLFDSLQGVARNSLPPIESWQPSTEGAIDITIRADGSWWHEGGEIRRHALVKLFASILYCEEQQHYLVTPAEKLRIIVEDSAMLIIESQVAEVNGEQSIVVRTNLDDAISIDADHPVELRDNLPYVHVRRGLWAKVNRAVYYDWAEQAEEKTINGSSCLALQSARQWFSIGAL